MRKLGAMVLAVALMTAQTSFAADAAPAAAPLPPLAPGKAAGLQQAQNGPPQNLVFIGAGLVLAAVAVYLIVGTNYHIPAQNQSSSGTK